MARVLPLLPVAHLDREFDYLIPADLDEQARPGVRVRVRFSGRLVDGFLLERRDSSEHRGRLAWLDRIVSAEQVLTPEVRRLVDAVADRYAGTRADVLRLAIPPRHAKVEAETPDPVPPPERPTVDADAWASYVHGGNFVDALAAGRSPRAVWQALPGEDWCLRLAELAGWWRRPAAVSCWSSPISVTSTGSSRHAKTCSAHSMSWDSPPGWGRPHGTGAGSRRCAAPPASSSAPGPRCSRRPPPTSA